MKLKFRSRPAQIGLGALALLNFAHAGVMAQDASRAYFANDPLGRNLVTIRSEAPLETMLTRTGAVEADIKINPNDVLNAPRARFQIPVASLDTGIALRNQHMRGADYLDAAKYPTISFTLLKPLMRSEKKVIIAPGAKGEMPVEGELELHGVKKTVRAEVSVEVIPESLDTKARLDGDLMHIRATFPLKLDDFGIVVPDMAKLKVAGEQQVSVDVFVSTGSKAPAWAAPVAANFPANIELHKGTTVIQTPIGPVPLTLQGVRLNGKNNFAIGPTFGRTSKPSIAANMKAYSNQRPVISTQVGRVRFDPTVQVSRINGKTHFAIGPEF